MEIKQCHKESFVIIGKQGSTNDGQGFIEKLWNDANSNFQEVANLAKKDEDGFLYGVWGAMSDLEHHYLPWQDNFSKGLYLAGVECTKDSVAPKGWTKWIIPAYDYLYVESEPDIFINMIKYLNDNDIKLVGAVNDFTDVKTKKNYMYFPIKKY